MRGTYAPGCQHCGMSWDVEPVEVRPLRQSDGPTQVVHWCARCRTTPERWVRFVPVVAIGTIGTIGTYGSSNAAKTTRTKCTSIGRVRVR